MTEADAKRTAELLLARYCLRGWRVVLAANMRSKDGKPLYSKSDPALEAICIATERLHDDAETVDKILHEIAHTLAREDGHTPTFYKILKSLRNDYKRSPVYISYPRLRVTQG
jgi:hypothetical protein